MSLAQNIYRLEGKVTESNTKEIVEMVAIQIKELNRWTTSDMNGNFVFKNIPGGTYTLQASCVGFEKYERQITIERDISGYKLMIKQSSLGLEEVTITAKENTSLSSSSKIESTALEHVQPTGLADVMQLIPGQITLNPDMSKSNQITIRDINTSNNPDNNSAMGTAIIVDGTPVNNDGNMQTLNTSAGGTSQAFSTAGQGVDLRQISTDQVESVEVIRGIPSVEYGNLTTGAVLVKTKAGKTKLYSKLKADPNIKQLAFSKGFLLAGDNNGAMNVDLDYTKAFDDLREPTKSYQRVTGQLGYSNTYFRASNPLSVNVKLSYYSTFDNQKNDPDMLQQEILEAKEQSLGFKLYGNWSVKKPWLTSLSYNFSGNFDQQDTYEYKVTSGSVTPMPTSMVSGESIGIILPSSYLSELTIDGQPYNYFGTIKGNITKRYGKTDHNLMFGAEWRTSGNNGKGRIYDLTRPPSGATSTRPRAFKDTPPSKELSLYIEEKIGIPIGETKLNTQFGVRYNNLLPTSLFSTKGYMNLEPRLNITYELVKNNRNSDLKNLAVRFGYGKTSKTPSMMYLYPDKYYRDELSFNYYPDLVVITTKVFDDTSNPDLKPTTNTKFETGLDFNLFGVDVMITLFKENLVDGFSWDSHYFVNEYRKWNSLDGAGKNPVFNQGNITYTENGISKILPFSMKNEFRSYQSPINDYSIKKKGIEYVLDFGKIKPLKSNIIVDGAYYNINKVDKVLPYYTKENILYLGEIFPYLSVFPGNSGSTKQRLNSNIKINTHIPALKMITSITGMVIMFEKTKYSWEDSDGNEIAYSLGPNNEKMYGQFEGADKIFIDPVGYFDKNMTYHPWQNNYSFEAPYSFMVLQRRDDYYITESLPFTWQINLKLTKEIGDKAKLSFFANNLLNHRPLHKFLRSDSYIRRNAPAYFGAELKLTL